MVFTIRPKTPNGSFFWCGKDGYLSVNCKRRKNLKYLSLFVVLFMLGGCASNPSGSSWAVADFNKYDKNYAPFPTKQLSIGMSKNEVLALLGSDYELVEAGLEYDVLAYQQWVAVHGPDYVGKTLYLKLEHGQLTHWSITNDTTAIVPRSW
jgi:hypothetical protein